MGFIETKSFCTKSYLFFLDYPEFWKFLDFVVSTRLGDFLLLMPFMRSRISKLHCDSRSLPFQQIVINKLHSPFCTVSDGGFALFYGCASGSSAFSIQISAIVSEVEALRDEVLFGSHAEVSARSSRLNTISNVSELGKEQDLKIEKEQEQEVECKLVRESSIGVSPQRTPDRSAHSFRGSTVTHSSVGESTPPSKRTSRSASVRLSIKEQAKRLLEMVTDEESRRHERRALADVERLKELEDSERALNGEDTPDNTETADDFIHGVGKSFGELPGNRNCMLCNTFLIKAYSLSCCFSISLSFSFSIYFYIYFLWFYSCFK